MEISSIMRQLPHSKQNQTTATSHAAARQHSPTKLKRLAEDLINQLYVLNLIAVKLEKGRSDRSGVASECDWQTFDGCVRQTILLGEQMAQLLKRPTDIATDDPSSPLNSEGRVIRLLRMVPKQNQ